MIIEHHVDLGHNKLRVEKTDNIKKNKKERPADIIEETEEEETSDSLQEEEIGNETKKEDAHHDIYTKEREIQKKKRKGEKLDVRA